MKTGIIVAVSVLSGIVLLLTIINLIFSYTRKKLKNHIQKKFDKEKIIMATTSANFFGEKSKGGKQIRGNGALVLTKGEVFFIRAVPFTEYIIPIESITEISTPTSFNGKTVFSKLLRIQYKTDSGSDAMAWAIRNPNKWEEAIEKLIHFRYSLQ